MCLLPFLDDVSQKKNESTVNEYCLKFLDGIFVIWIKLVYIHYVEKIMPNKQLWSDELTLGEKLSTLFNEINSQIE